LVTAATISARDARSASGDSVGGLRSTAFGTRYGDHSWELSRKEGDSKRTTADDEVRYACCRDPRRDLAAILAKRCDKWSAEERLSGESCSRISGLRSLHLAVVVWPALHDTPLS
jgi:hypothetical protein